MSINIGGLLSARYTPYYITPDLVRYRKISRTSANSKASSHIPLIPPLSIFFSVCSSYLLSLHSSSICSPIFSSLCDVISAVPAGLPMEWGLLESSSRELRVS